MFEDEHLRLGIVDVRVHVLKERLVQRNKTHVERAYPQCVYDAVAMVRIEYLDEPDLEMRRIEIAGPGVEDDRPVPAGCLFVEILRKLLRALNAVLLLRSLHGERDARIIERLFIGGRLQRAARAVYFP